ncbi:MAG TPA: starch-binding protein [Paludibacter sp.]|nr:starch-binding protein [Paludibacter sp.]
MKKFLLLLSIGALISFTLSAEVTYNVTVPAGTIKCYIAGDFAAPTANWGQIEMTKVDATHYTITISNATGTEGYKYCSGPTWAYVEKQADCSSDIGDRTYSPNDVVQCWGAVYDPAAVKKDVTIKTRSPWPSTYIYYWGDATNNPWPGTIMTQNGDWWEFTIPQITTVSIIFNDATGNQTANINNISSNTCFVVAADKSYTIVDCIMTSTATPEKPAVKINSENSRILVELEGNATMLVYSMQGALVKQADFHNTYTIDNLNSGLYLLKINGKSYKAIVR